MGRRSTAGWEKYNDTKYVNKNTSAKAEIIARVVEGRTKYAAQVIVDGHAIKNSYFTSKKDARDYILDYVDENSNPTLNCKECQSKNLNICSKDEEETHDATWYVCQDCSYISLRGRYYH